jgi:hypothetical protein
VFDYKIDTQLQRQRQRQRQTIMQLENIILIIICSLIFMAVTSMFCSVKAYLTDKLVIRVATEAKIIPIEMAYVCKTTDTDTDTETETDIESQLSIATPIMT